MLLQSSGTTHIVLRKVLLHIKPLNQSLWFQMVGTSYITHTFKCYLRATAFRNEITLAIHNPFSINHLSRSMEWIRTTIFKLKT